MLSPALTFDWAIINGDLATDDGLDTAVAISLWTTRVLSPDDVPTGPGGDLGGWWGDAYLPALADGQLRTALAPNSGAGRARLQTLETAQGMQADAQQALQWMVDDGVVASVTVPLPMFPERGMASIVVILAQQAASGGDGEPALHTSLWNMTRGAVVDVRDCGRRDARRCRHSGVPRFRN